MKKIILHYIDDNDRERYTLASLPHKPNDVKYMIETLFINLSEKEIYALWKLTKDELLKILEDTINHNLLHTIKPN